jgi:hypothetical protein
MIMDSIFYPDGDLSFEGWEPPPTPTDEDAPPIADEAPNLPPAEPVSLPPEREEFLDFPLPESVTLHPITMEQLYERQYLSRSSIVQNLLTKGLYLFVGAPKIGKSYFALQLGYHIANGIPLWGREVWQGEVLYLALEDQFSRLQSRLYQMVGCNVTKDFYLVTEADSLKDGLLSQLQLFVNVHPRVNCIIIDTLQKVREFSNNCFSYSSDYEVICQLKAFADRNNLCVLMVHHTRKMESDDDFATISGTNGLFGAADGCLLLKKENRSERDAQLSVVGRDVPDQTLSLRQREDTCVWSLVSEEKATFSPKPDPLLLEIATLVNPENPYWSGSPTALCEALKTVEESPRHITRRLNVMTDRLYHDYNIFYESKRNHKDGRYLTFRYLDPNP